MSKQTGYDVFFDKYFVLPFAPPSMKISVGSRNETITLINEGEVNILKSPSLVEVEFEMRLPQQQYPFARALKPVRYYMDVLKKLKAEKRPFQFIVVRSTPSGRVLFDTNLTMVVEEYTMDEDSEEGLDVLVDVKLKQYKSYGLKTAVIKTQTTTSKPVSTVSTTVTRPSTNSNSGSVYVVKSGDCLWNIAKSKYGDGSQWTKIYNANKSSIEADAKKHGKKSSSNGHWIWPGLRLTIP